jgi:hypothetical protein
MEKNDRTIIFLVLILVSVSLVLFMGRNSTELRNPTAAEASAFIKRYCAVTEPSTICVVAADDFKAEAEKSGLSCGKICVQFRYNKDGNEDYYIGGNHAFNFFETSDLGIMWFDPQNGLCLPSAWISLETFLQIEYGNVALVYFYIADPF